MADIEMRDVSPTEAFCRLRDYILCSVAQNSYLLKKSCESKLDACLAGREDAETLKNAFMEARSRYNQAVQAALERYFQALNDASESGAFYPDADQIRMVAVDENCCLVIAGAGTGKSSTLAATVRNLLDRGDWREEMEAEGPERDVLEQAGNELLRLLRLLGPVGEFRLQPVPVRPEEILILSYSNKAVQDLKDKFNSEPFLIPMAEREKGGVSVSTFHSLGNAILRQAGRMNAGANDGERRPGSGRREDRQGLPGEVVDFFKETYLKDPVWTDRLLLFFAQTFRFPNVEKGSTLYQFYFENAKARMTTPRTLKEEQAENRGRWRTIRGEMMRSDQEVMIADYLCENGIDYQYEPKYLDKDGNMVSLGGNKYYTPDFLLVNPVNGKQWYYEHFGMISETPPDSEEEELRRYREDSEEKKEFLEAQGRELLFTYGKYGSGKDYVAPIEILLRLSRILTGHGFVLKPHNTPDEIVRYLAERRVDVCIKPFTDLIWDFISACDAKGGEEQYEAWLKPVEQEGAVKNERTRLFLEICQACHQKYRDYLASSDKTDFAKMITGATEILNQAPEGGSGGGLLPELGYKYIFVDEYQDISKSRSQFLKALRRFCGARLMAIGDDWQSIYAFSGSDVSLFTGFWKEMEAEELGEMQLQVTYRNPQSLIDLAGAFVEKNPHQKPKKLCSRHPGKIDDPVVVYLYEEGDPEEIKQEALQDGREITDSAAWTYAQYYTSHTIRLALEEILEQIMDSEKLRRRRAEEKGEKWEIPEILFLGRYNFDSKEFLEGSRGKGVVNSGLFTRVGTKVDGEGEQWILTGGSVFNQMFKFTFRTVHGAKGAQADYVVLLNGKDDPWSGFPSKRDSDTVLSLVIPSDDSYPYAEERRLFYVALTRTKERVYCLAPRNHPSEFLVELQEIAREGIKQGKQGRVVIKTLDEEEEEWRETEDAFDGWEADQAVYQPRCPQCGKPLKRLDQIINQQWGPLKSRLYWSKYGRCINCDSMGQLFICTNDQTKCGFMTNNLAGGAAPIRKCSCGQERECRKSDRYYRVQHLLRRNSGDGADDYNRRYRHVNKYYLRVPCEKMGPVYVDENLPRGLRVPASEEERVFMMEEDLVVRALTQLNFQMSYTFGQSKFLQIFQQEDPSSLFRASQKSCVRDLRREFPELLKLSASGRLESAVIRAQEKNWLCSSLGLRLTHEGVMFGWCMVLLRAVQWFRAVTGYYYGKKNFLSIFCDGNLQRFKGDAQWLEEKLESYPETQELMDLGRYSAERLISGLVNCGILEERTIQRTNWTMLCSGEGAPVWFPEN